MRGADMAECLALGHTPLQALTAGLLSGPSFGVFRQNDCVAAFGVGMSAGTIWSLWSATIDWIEGLEIVRETPRWVLQLVQLSGRSSLYNYVDIHNTAALEWLRMSGAFTMDEGDLLQVKGTTYMRFATNV